MRVDEIIELDMEGFTPLDFTDTAGFEVGALYDPDTMELTAYGLRFHDENDDPVTPLLLVPVEGLYVILHDLMQVLSTSKR